MNRIKCIVSYDGSKFHGFQIQNKLRTVQGEIQRQFIIFVKMKKLLFMLVDAQMQKCMEENKYFILIQNVICQKNNGKEQSNHFLSNDIYILDSFLVDEDFHSRYSATKKEYHYLLSMNEYSPFETNYIYQYGKSLDIKAMKEAAKIFIGEHNFASFCAIDPYGNTIRTLYQLDIIEKNGIVTFKLIGNGFRRYMVRHIVGGLIQVGAHRIDKAKLEELLESKGEKKCLFKAKPQGLYLHEVFYE